MMLCAFLALGLIGACGKKMWPISPDEVLPGPVREFRLSQDGESLVVTWLFPQENQLGQPLTQLEGFRLYRCASPGTKPAAGCAPDYVLVADIDLAYPKVGEVRGEAVAFRDRHLTPGRCYTYRVAAYSQRGYLGAWSKELSQAWGVLPRAPGLLTAAAGDREVQLSWPEVLTLQDGRAIPDLAGYYVYRRGPQGDWQRLTRNPRPPPVFKMWRCKTKWNILI